MASANGTKQDDVVGSAPPMPPKSRSKEETNIRRPLDPQRFVVRVMGVFPKHSEWTTDPETGKRVPMGSQKASASGKKQWEVKCKLEVRGNQEVTEEDIWINTSGEEAPKIKSGIYITCLDLIGEYYVKRDGSIGESLWGWKFKGVKQAQELYDLDNE